MKSTAWPVALVGVVLALSACAGPNRAPRVNQDPVEGANRRHDAEVERRRREAERQERQEALERDGQRQGAEGGAENDGGGQTTAGGDAPAARRPAADSGAGAGDWRALAADFGERLAAASADLDGAIVVFPVLCQTQARDRWAVPPLGVDVADAVVRPLTAAGRRVLTGRELEQAMGMVNRGWSDVARPEDCAAVAQRLSDVFFVSAFTSGTFAQHTGTGFGGVGPLVLELEAATLPAARGVLPQARRSWEPGRRAYAEVVTALDRSGAGGVPIGAAAPTFQRSSDIEFAYTAGALLGQVLDRDPEQLVGRRVYVEPLVVPGSRQRTAELEAWRREFGRKLGAAEREADTAGATDAFATAMAEPLSVGGTDYDSGWSAVGAYERRRAARLGDRAGQLGRKLADDIGGIVERITGGEVTLIRPEDRQALVALIQADLFEARSDDSVDADTIAFTQSPSFDVVIRPELHEGIDAGFYELSIRVVDAADPTRSGAAKTMLPAEVGAKVEAALTGR